MAKGGGKGAQETFQKLLKCHVATSQIAKILTLSFNVPCGLIERVMKEARDKRAALVACTRKESERGGGEWGIRWRSHGSDADTKTKPRQGRARRGEVQVPVRRKSNTQVSLFTSLPPPANRNSTCERQFDPRHFWVANPVGGRGRA